MTMDCFEDPSCGLLGFNWAQTSTFKESHFTFVKLFPYKSSDPKTRAHAKCPPNYHVILC